MKPSRTLFFMLVAACLAARAAHADAAKGAQIAQQWCSSCHLTGATQSGPVPQGPPSFQTVATSGMTVDQLRAFLSHPHGSMPNLTLTRAEIDDLINYIATLR